MAIQITGAFRVEKRTVDHWEVFYKHFGSGIMVLICSGLSRSLAIELKQNLNDQLRGEITEEEVQGRKLHATEGRVVPSQGLNRKAT